MKKIVLLTLIFCNLLLSNGFDLNFCLNQNSYHICPNKDSKILSTLSIFKEKQITNKQKTQISFDNIQISNNPTKFFIVPDFEGYLTIIRVDSNGERKQFFPNKSLSDNYVKKGELINLSYNNSIELEANGSLKYFIIIITAERVFFNAAKKDNIYDAFSNDKIFKNILNNIKLNKYGRYFLKLLPYYILREK